MKLRMDYSGLVIRCATAQEHEQMMAEAGSTHRNSRVLMFVTDYGLDYVVTGAMGWYEDDQEDRDPSALAFFVGATDPTRLMPSDVDIPWSKQQQIARESDES